jgi:REP element-mobilizing transposase RayT
MPRTPRSIIAGLVYHLISRFVDRDWFITNERERSHYLELFGRAIAKSDWRCIGYGVMSNHIHHSVVAGRHSLASWIRRAHSPFADFMNKEYDRIGPLFVRGPRALETDPHDTARLVAYIHNNPVRANVVTKAAASTWTSHRAYLGFEKPPRWLDVDLGLRLCGFTDPLEFDRFVELHPSDPAREALERGTIQIDPSALFREAIDRTRERRVPPSARAIVEATATEVGIEPSVLCSRGRSRPQQFARAVAVHCAHSLGVTGVAIAEALGITQPGACVALRRGMKQPEVIEKSAVVTRRFEREL